MLDAGYSYPYTAGFEVVQKRLNRSRCRSGVRLARAQGTMLHGRHLANTIEECVLGGDTGCRYRYFSNLFFLQRVSLSKRQRRTHHSACDSIICILALLGSYLAAAPLSRLLATSSICDCITSQPPLPVWSEPSSE